jgi:hypothetical protein
MKFIVSILFLVISATAGALTCANYVPPNGETIQLVLDTDVTYFTVPATLDGLDVQAVTLWAYPVKGSSGELVAPLAFKIKKGFAKGHFAITAPFVEAEITATYSKDLCGPRLESSVSI